jgi:FdhD protein
MSDPERLPEDRRRSREISRFEDGSIRNVSDFLATEEPLEIRIVFGPEGKRKDRSLSITMRTPGNDEELAAGFLLGEGIVGDAAQIQKFERVGPEGSSQLCVHLDPGVEFDFANLQRNFYMTSSCGICGMASLEAVRSRLGNPITSSNLVVAASVINSLPAALREVQETFEETGGLHAAGLFANDGKLIACREDVGRHNAMDKLIGHRSLTGHLPGNESLVLVSGRASFELVQKVISAGIPIMVAVGAPSSLAAELAAEFGVTLIGFASGIRFNIYTHAKRVVAH